MRSGYIFIMYRFCTYTRGPQYKYMMGYKASLNESFIKDFMTLNTITFADMAKRENDRVSWDVRRVSSP